MPKTDYVSDLDGEQIEAALEAIHDVVTPSNNGKVLCIVGGKIAAKSASEWGGGGYPEPTGTIPITANGTVNVKDYASAEVNVPTGITAADNGKVVKNGVLVAQTARANEITTNGTYDTTENNSVTVNVSDGGGGTKEFLYEFNESQGNVWINTNVSVSDIETLCFDDVRSGDVIKHVVIDVSDIAVYTGGTDVYTPIFTQTKPMNVRIYNGNLYVSYNGAGPATNVTKVYKYSEGGGGGSNNVETVSHYAWNYQGWAGWAVMKKLDGAVIGRNMVNRTQYDLIGDLIKFTYYGDNIAPIITALVDVSLKIYQTSKTSTSEITSTVQTLTADQTLTLQALNYIGGYYIEAEVL